MIGRLRSRALSVAGLWVGAYLVGVVALHYIGLHLRLAADTAGGGDASGGFVPALRQLLGRVDRRDFYVDYASAHALTHGLDAYDKSSILFHGIGPAWAVNGPNPHPPTLLTLVLPFTVLHYGGALAAWALAMVFALILTVHLVGVRLSYAIGIGIGLSVTFPGAFGIGNPVPIIGLGVALAYRYRDRPLVAGLGIALAAMPKGSGVILVLPFLAAARIRTALYAAGFYLVAALVPLFFQGNVWHRYLSYGTKSITANANDRADNASLLYLAHAHFGWSHQVTVVFLVLVTIGLAFVQRDLFWPVVWAMVALLPIGWMYSLLTLVPLVVRAVLTAPRRTVGLAALATGITVASPPSGLWPTRTYPLVLLLVAGICVLARPPSPTLWFERWTRPRLARRPSSLDAPVRMPVG